MKTCTWCKTEKAESEFNTHPTYPDGRFPYCKTCNRERTSIAKTIPRSIVCRDEPNFTRKDWDATTTEHRAELKRKHATAISAAVGETNVASLNYDRDDTDYLYPGLEERRANRVKRYTPVDREDQEEAKDGLIYVITNPAWPDHCKIGETTDLRDRLRQYQTASPYRDYEVFFSLHVEDRKAMEKAVFSALIERGLNEKGEWFFINQWHAENLIYKVKRDSQKENDNAHTNSRHRGQRVPPCSGHDLAG